MKAEEYHRIAHTYIDDVYRAALSCCRSREDAEDAVQITFLKLLTTQTDFNSEEHIRRWLIRVVVNECRNHLNSFWHRNVASLEESDDIPAGYTEDERWLYDEIRRLPPKYRSVLHLHYYEGYTCAEVADILHISESNVQTRLMRARKMLKKNIEEA